MDPRPIFFFAFVAIFVLVSLVQIYRRPLMHKLSSRIFLYSAGLVGIYLILISYLQFSAFLGGPLQAVLGTGDGFRWFLGYVKLHYANEYLISFPVAIIFALVARYLNRRFSERFFESEELYLIALGILLTGYPGFIFYIPLVLLVSIIASLIFVPRGERLPLYHFWAPVGVAVLLAIHFWASHMPWWSQFRF